MGAYSFLRKLYNECTLKLGIAQDFKVSFLSCKHKKKIFNSCPRFLHLSKGTQGTAAPPSLIDFHINRSN